MASDNHGTEFDDLSHRDNRPLLSANPGNPSGSTGAPRAPYIHPERKLQWSQPTARAIILAKLSAVRNGRLCRLSRRNDHGFSEQGQLRSPTEKSLQHFEYHIELSIGLQLQRKSMA